jgi:hypothetical protein
MNLTSLTSPSGLASAGLRCGNVVPFDALFLAGRERCVYVFQKLVDELLQGIMACSFTRNEGGHISYVAFVGEGGTGICFPTIRSASSKQFVQQLVLSEHLIFYSDPDLVKGLHKVWGVLPSRVAFFDGGESRFEQVFTALNMSHSTYYLAIAQSISILGRALEDKPILENFCEGSRVIGTLSFDPSSPSSVSLAPPAVVHQEESKDLCVQGSVRPTPTHPFKIEKLSASDSNEWNFICTSAIPVPSDLEYQSWMANFPTISNTLYSKFDPPSNMSPILAINNMLNHGLSANYVYERIDFPDKLKPAWKCVCMATFRDADDQIVHVNIVVSAANKVSGRAIAAAALLRVTRGLRA